MPTSFLWTLVFICILACAGTVVAEKMQRTRFHAGLKIMASATFVFGVFFMPAYATPYGHQIAWAACWGLVGDVLILHPSQRGFLGALVAFLCGHILYTGALAHRGLVPSHTALACVVLGVAALGVRAWLWPHLAPKMRFAVAAYLFTISAMVISAWGSARYSILPGRQILGATLFYLSDLSVARQAFVKASWRNSLVGLPLYYSAQWLLIGTLGFS